MNLSLSPSALGGTVNNIISSKSMAHRILIAAFLADRPTEIECNSFSQDIEATANCLVSAGAEILRTDRGMTLTPFRRVADSPLLDCRESGSTLRFLLPVMSALGANARFTGKPRLAARPLSPLYEELAAHGMTFSPQGAFPLESTGRLSGGQYTLDGGVSSQYISGLLLALPLLREDSVIRVTGSFESRSYVDLTLSVLHLFGIEAERGDSVFYIRGGQSYRSPLRIAAEGDWSNGAFWLSAGALSEQGVLVSGLNPDSLQGDRQILSLLRQFGAQVSLSERGILVKKGTLSGISVNASDIPDLVPVLCAVAAAARGTTVITGIARLRLKESDRIESIRAMLSSLGVSVQASDQALVVHGKEQLDGGTVHACGDHRIVMSAAVASLACKNTVTIAGVEAVDKSYPGFFRIWKHLGGIISDER